LSKKDLTNSRFQAVKFALEGIKHVLITQPNAKIHAAFTLAVLLFAGLLRLPRLEWVIILLTIGFVWAAEIFNTAIEIIVDVFHPDYDPNAKIIKDLSAGAVLISVLVSILVGLLVFGPHLWNGIRLLF
jgi:diacylglycerol kinase